MSEHTDVYYLESLIAARPHVTSYDSGFEHSLEHFIGVRQLVDEAVRETILATTVESNANRVELPGQLSLTTR